ncbi:hypothetical protein HCU40_03370 [Pseudanabaena biceps]|nr:hypothetical protein [Pseudanabaena biceps]
MSSNLRLKSSITLLVLAAAMLASPKQPTKVPTSALISHQPAIAASAIGAIALSIHQSDNII